MAIPKFFVDAAGIWSGSKKLHLSWLQGDKKVTTSSSPMSIVVGSNDAYVTISYTWAYEGKKQDGKVTLIGSGVGKPITAAWVDSWHQSSSVMNLTGLWEDGNKVTLLGSYSAGTGPAWGWSIEFTLVDKDIFNMFMTNFTPEGQGEWAVDAQYKRG